MCSQALFWWMSLTGIIHLYFLKHWGMSDDIGLAPRYLNWIGQAAP